MFHSFLGPSYSWFAWNLVHQLLRSRDPCSPALRPVHASIRSLLPTGRHGVKWKVSQIKLTRKQGEIMLNKLYPTKNYCYFMCEPLWASPYLVGLVCFKLL